MDSKVDLISIIEFRHCLLGTGCDMFQIDTSSAPQLKCTFFANTPMKTMVNLYKYIRYRPQTLSDVQIYILHCSIPQENVVKNSDFFTQTHLRKFSLKIWFLSYHFIFEFIPELMLLFEKFQISYLAWKLESDLCGSKLHQYSTLTTKAASFNGFREYILKLDCQNQGKEIQMIYGLFLVNCYLLYVPSLLSQLGGIR